ncbi:MAG: hypothetical protein KC421_02000 [Anaerolineales bacterium]|nr:hypothetical protein [Anaerolineales bacterium]
MNEAQIRQAFEYINRTGEYFCHMTEAQDDYIAYAAEADIEMLRRERMIIDVTFYLDLNTTVFAMLLSEGFWGDNLHLMNGLLLQINSVTRGGAFALWPNSSEIVFKYDYPTEYLNPQRILHILRYFEQVFKGIRPKLELFAGDLGLHYISDAEKTEMARNLDWYFRGLESSLKS